MHSDELNGESWWWRAKNNKRVNVAETVRNRTWCANAVQNGRVRRAHSKREDGMVKRLVVGADGAWNIPDRIDQKR